MTTARDRTAPAVASPTEAPAPVSRTPAWAVALLLILGVAYVMLFVSAIMAADTELLHGLTIAPILFGLTVPIAFKVARSDRDPALVLIVLAGAATKLMAAYVQFKIGYGYYKGRVDAQSYHLIGEQLAPQFRRLDFSVHGSLVGNGYTNILTGIVYAITGVGRVAGYMVFAWLGFLGLLLLARAFHIGIPTGASRRYLVLVLFMPSLLYWTSAIGKEAPVMLGIGLAVYGMANLLQSRTQGVIPLAAGIFVVLLIRPHIALILFGAFVFAVLIRRAPARSFAAPMLRLVGIVGLILLAFFLLSRTSAFLDTKLQTTSLSDQLSETQERTTEAGSAFTPATVNSPIDLPWAAATVLFRPFPNEASGFAGLLAGVEGMFIIGLFVLSWNRVRSVTKMLRTTPYVAFSLAYVVAFIVAFSRFANFGLLARQRVQVLPFVLVFLALPRLRDLTGGQQRRRAHRSRPALPTRPVGPEGARRRLRPPAPEPAARGAVSTGSEFSPPARPPA